MGFRINTNIAAMNAHMNSTQNNIGLDRSLNSLSSGLRINRAADDASGLAIANQLSAQSNGLGQAIRNSNDGIGMIQTADGALEETGNILNRIRTLAVQSANDTQTDASRAYIQEEVTALTQQLNDISSRTSFNGQQLLDGTGGSTQTAASGNLPVSAVAQVDTVTLSQAAGVAGMEAADALAIVVGGTTFTETGTAYATLDEAGTALAALVNADGAYIATYDDATDVMTITAAVAGTAFTTGTPTFTDDTTTDDNGEITGVVATTTDNVVEVLDTYVGASANFSFHSGAYSNEVTTVDIASASAAALHVSTIDVSTTAGAELAIATADAGIVAVDTLRSTLGAAQNKLESNVRNISVTQVNVAAAESNIRDVDFAQESANFAKHNILAQSGTYAMSQANAVQQNVLRLLQ